MTESGVSVTSVRQVYNDGNHNAFTDLCEFNGGYYLVFRNCPGGHPVLNTSRIIVLKAGDGMTWEQVFSFNVPGRDVRDPHLLVFKDRLFVYSGTWLVDPDDCNYLVMNEHQGYCAWSDDGSDWHGPVPMKGTHGYYVWRAGAHGDTAYLIGRRLKDFEPVPGTAEARYRMRRLTQSWFLKSDDGFTWEPVGLLQSAFGDETAFVFEDDGRVIGIGRDGAGRPAHVWRSSPPYTTWTSTDLDRKVEGPVLAKWGQRYLVGGRKPLDEKRSITALYWLVDDALEEIAELPSGGDNSYPGFVQVAPDRAWVSYYSSHEGSGTIWPPSAIYLAELALDV